MKHGLNTDSEKTRYGTNGIHRDAGGGGKRWVGKLVDLGKGGRAAGKWSGFSHVFPHNSTQVVDFPRICNVRTFLDANFTNERELGKGREQGTEIGRKRTQKIRNSTGQTRAGCRRIRILVAIFVTERSLMFAYVRLKSLMFSFFDKKYFIPALRSRCADTQLVGVRDGWRGNRPFCFGRVLGLVRAIYE